MKNVFSWVPNFLTLCNLFCGAVGVVFALDGNFQISFIMCLLSGVLDFCDGFAARLLKAYSPLGKELDSLADMVSFGLLPSVVMFKLLLTDFAGIISFTAFAIVAFSALRLAKFNIDETQSEQFIGMPTPACALFFVSYALATPFIPFYGTTLNLLLIALFSFLLVSPIPMIAFKFKSFAVKTNIDKYLFIIASIVLIIFLQEFSFAIIIICYALFNISMWLLGKLKRK